MTGCVYIPVYIQIIIAITKIFEAADFCKNNNFLRNFRARAMPVKWLLENEATQQASCIAVLMRAPNILIL